MEISLPLTCPECGLDLRTPSAIVVQYKASSTHFEEAGQIDDDGILEDTEDLIAHGKYTGSYCARCQEPLESDSL